MKPSHRRCIILLMLSASISLPISADGQFGLRFDPVVLVPFGNSSGVKNGGQNVELYSLGYGARITGSLSYFGFLSPFASLDVNNVPVNGVSGSSLLSEQLGVGVSVFAYPFPRLITSAGIGGGLGNTTFSTSGSSLSGMSPFWKIDTELGYRFTPSFSLSGLMGYTETLGTVSAIYKGFAVGLRFNLGLDIFGVGSSGVEMAPVHQDRLLPITYYKADKVAIAKVRVRDTDSAEIRDVKVSFSAGTYTSRPADCGNFDIIQHNDSVEVPIYANFNDNVLGFTEPTKIQGEVKISYRILDAQKTITKPLTIEFNSRNSTTWADPNVIGAFISPQDPVMLELSKYLAGLVRVRIIPEIDKSLQYGMGVFEGLRLYGLVWNADPTIPYTKARRDTSQLAYIQYPAQTLSYKSGDSDALALTFIEALESIAVPGAIAVLPEDVIAAFPLDMGEPQARATFSNPNMFIFDSGKVWVPLRVSLIRDGFLRAWQGGADLWRSQPAASHPQLVKVDDAWKEFSPVAIAATDFKPVKPGEEQINQAFGTVLSRFAQSEVEPKVRRILATINGEPTGAQHNRLGIAYAQYGFYDRAKEEFEKAVSKNYSPSIINLANIAFLKKDYRTASAGFEKALSANPANKNVLLGLARARYELGDYEGTNQLYLKVKAIDPGLAARFSYLSAKVDEEPATTATPVGQSGG